MCVQLCETQWSEKKDETIDCDDCDWIENNENPFNDLIKRFDCFECYFICVFLSNRNITYNSIMIIYTQESNYANKIENKQNPNECDWIENRNQVPEFNRK